MKYRVRLSWIDSVGTHYYTTDVEGKNPGDAEYKARAKFVESEEYPEKYRGCCAKAKLEAPYVEWVVKMNNNHLYPDYFNSIRTDSAGFWVSLHELCEMIDSGAITINKDKLKN